MTCDQILKDGMATRKVEIINREDWVIFAQSYFHIARLACQELLDRRQNKHDKSLSSKTSLDYKIIDLYISIVFSIKHGLEVYIKGLNIFAYGEYDEGHNLDDLFSKVSSKIKSDSKLKKLKPDIDGLENIIRHFYKLEFLNIGPRSHYGIEDVNNDIFRYPDNKARLRPFWEMILLDVKEDDIKNLLEQAKRALSLFNRSGFLIENQK